MTTERKDAKALDEALKGASSSDETRPLTETADALRGALATDVPPADRQRALFLSGVSARDRARFSPLRVLVPAMAIAVLIFAVIASSRALPGEQLYPMREALNAVGIGDTPVDEIDDHLNQAAALVSQADRVVETNPDRALALAVRALEQLGPARELVPELNGERQEERIETIEDLEERAVQTIEEALEEGEEEAEESDEDGGSGSDDSGDDDDSGSGSDDSGGDDDNSGSGSDDSGGDDDNSGSGSDDSGSDDNSGSGSDDSSGSGGGDDSGSNSGSG